MKSPLNPFKIEKDGVPIGQLAPPKVKGQINITASSLAFGTVPLYEEHKARVEAGYTLPEWRGLSHMDRAYEVATRRMSILIETFQAEGK